MALLDIPPDRGTERGGGLGMTHEYRMTLDEAVIRLRNEFNKDGCYVELPLNVAEELLKAAEERLAEDDE